MAVCPLEQWFETDASRLMGEIFDQGRAQGRVSALITKGEIPEGAGYNYVTVVSERTAPASPYAWSDIDPPDGDNNNCAPPAYEVPWATSTLAYNAERLTLKSSRVCFTDAVKGYLFREQVANIRKNFRNNVVDSLDDRDKLAFFQNAGVKIVADSSMTTYYNQADFGPTLPTLPVAQAYLDAIYNILLRDGYGEKAYAMSDGGPLVTAIMSPEASRQIIKGSADVRQDFRFAEMGEGKEATLLKAWGVDRAYGGFLHLIDVRMPRWNYTNGAWVPVPYYINTATHIGNKATPNPAYQWAQYEDIFFWHPDVVQRLMGRPTHSLGSGTTFDEYSHSGDVFFQVIKNEDPDNCLYNPLGEWGRYWADIQAAYKPGLQNLGVVLRYKRCFNLDVDPCEGGY